MIAGVTDYGAASFADWAGTRLGVEFNAKDYKGVPFQEAQEQAKSEALDHRSACGVRQRLEQAI